MPPELIFLIFTSAPDAARGGLVTSELDVCTVRPSNPLNANQRRVKSATLELTKRNMAIQLKANEQPLRAKIEENVEKARKAFAESRMDDEVGEWIMEAGEKAHELHMALKSRGHEPKHHAYMIENRELPPDHPEFYMHFHPLEDLLKFLEDEHANDDPKDQTIGANFTFRVFSRRWGHDDNYQVKRTEDGWNITHIAIGGPCDKGGRPFLFENLRHDSIHFPEGLDGWMEWLWTKAANQGLTQAQVQAALQQLADWVSNTEKNAPSGGVWQGF